MTKPTTKPTTKPDERASRRVPRVAVLAVALTALGIAAFLVNLASKAGDQPREDAEVAAGVEAAVSTAGEGGDIFLKCTDCHKNLDRVFDEGRAPGLTYRHEVHFEKGVSDCAMCHSSPTHEPDKVNKPTMTRCFMCHGLTEEAMAPGACNVCHPPDFPTVPTSHTDPVQWRDVHGETALADPFLCTSCHEQPKCESCHGQGITMPHAKDWKDKPHIDKFFETGGQTCTNCHARAADAPDDCDSCHHPQAQGAPWRQVHPNIVKAEGGKQCFECHDPSTCASCHIRGEENFTNDQANFAASEPATSASG